MEVPLSMYGVCRKSKMISDELQSAGFSADYYHAGLITEEKQDKQEKWQSNQIQTIVATNAFGMGIDKPDVRIVVHIDVPNSIEEYYQEAGRAGRDLKKSFAVMLCRTYRQGDTKEKNNRNFPSKGNNNKSI